MSKNNVKGALDDWGFDIPKAIVKKEIKPVDAKIRKSGSQDSVKLVSKQSDQSKNKVMVKKPDSTKVGKLDTKVISKQENQEVENKFIYQNLKDNVEIIDKVILKSKTFDLPPNLIRRIKMEAASSDKKEYQIALEAFERYFKESF